MGKTEFTVLACKKVDAREECHWSHAWQRFKRSKGVKLNSTPRASNRVHKRAPGINSFMAMASGTLFCELQRTSLQMDQMTTEGWFRSRLINHGLQCLDGVYNANR
jgi:hypothetical protein